MSALERKIKHYAVCPIYILTLRDNPIGVRHIFYKSYEIEELKKVAREQIASCYITEIYTGNWILVSTLTEKGWIDNVEN